jgi:hypothetical protein
LLRKRLRNNCIEDRASALTPSKISERIIKSIELFGAYKNEEAKTYVGELG